MRFIKSKKIRYNVFISFFVSFFIAQSLASAQELFADVTIDITDSGFVTITGTTNHPGLLVDDNQSYTSKIKDNWYFNITKDEIFSEYIFKVLLPIGSSIYNVKSSGTVWIGEETNRLAIYGLGQNESISLNINYQLSKSSDNKKGSFFSTINIMLLFLIIVIVILIIFNLYRSYKKREVVGRSNVDKYRGLTMRQKQIMKILNESSKPLTQTEIEKILNMPKAAVSRNVHSLERKGFIEIEKAGMSNFIRIKK
jgi:uncharacterized membrane protein